jgi:hypothetical protein
MVAPVVGPVAAGRALVLDTAASSDADVATTVMLLELPADLRSRGVADLVGIAGACHDPLSRGAALPGRPAVMVRGGGSVGR